MVNETAQIAQGIDGAITGLMPVDLVPYKNIIIAIVMVLGSMVVARIVYYFVEKYFKKLAAKTETKADDMILDLIHKPIYYVIILFGVQLAVGFLLVSGQYADYFSGFVTILLIGIVTWVVGGIVNILILEFGSKLAAKTESTLDDQAIPFLSKVARVAVYLLGLMVILGQMGIEITPLIASLGVVGIAIGFAAKDTIANLLAGFFILTDRPFGIGDRIQVGAFQGDVVDIGLRSTKIQTPDHTFVIIPNEKIILNEVTNYALPDPRLKVVIKFGVAYGSEVDKVKKAVMEVVTRTNSVLKDPEPTVHFRAFGDSGIDFVLVAWINTFKDQFKVIDELNTCIYNEFSRKGIEIPFPVRTVYLKKEV